MAPTMLQEPSLAVAEPEGQSTAQILYTVIRFLLAVRYRWNVIVAALVAAGLLGGLYYATATRYYAASASLLVMCTASDVTSPSMAASGTLQQNCTPTFENLITATKVIEGALPHLRPEDCPDLACTPKEQWPAIIHPRLSARALRNTNIICVTYQAKDPAAAVNVLNAVVQSYVDFLDKTNKGTAGEIIRVLTKEKSELGEKLTRKESELLEARRQFGDLGIRTDSKTVHPAVQCAIAFNESLIQAQKRRIELEASQAAIQAAIRNGEDLQQYVMTLADNVGKEMLSRSLGFDTQDAYALGNAERGLLDERAALKAMQEHLGPAHPEVVAKIEKIRINEQYLLGYQQRVKQQLAEIQSGQLIPLLLQTVQQRVREAQQLEASLQRQFEHARDEAVSLNGQMARLEIVEHDVTWLRNLHDVLLNRIASIDLKHEGQEIRTALVEEAKIPSDPVSPKLLVVALLVLAGGLATGLALVAVLDILDDRFRSLEEMQAQLRLPVLTIVRKLGATEAVGIGAVYTHAAPDSAESEAFRTLRTALTLADRETRRLVFSSTEPGDGKTTIVSNLAACCAQAGKKTLLIDADLRRPGLTTLLGMRGMDGLSRVLRGDDDVAKMAAAHIRSSGGEGLDILPSGARAANPAELLTGPRFAELLAWAETVYDQVLIDSPPTLVTSDVAMIGRLVDGVVLVVQPEKNRRRQVIRAAETLAIMKVPVLGIVVNRATSDKDDGYYGYGSGYGYGYGYGYEPETDDDGHSSDAEESDAEPTESPRTGNHREGDKRRAGIIPRRAA
jgi:polysaccharide biosynthesis transport protein